MNKKHIGQLLSESVEKLSKDSDRIVEIGFVTEKDIAALNKKYRRIDAPTDVLSFPENDISTPDNVLGSIIISLKIVNEKDENLDDVIKHGLLHLLGYDHEQNQQEWDRTAKLINCGL
ncbi:MAG: rRNA maturation RNase YbeY [Patescibacteria group bacterium]